MLKYILVVMAFLFAGIAADAADAPLPKWLNQDQINKVLETPAGDSDHFRFIVIGDTRDGDQMFAYLMDLAQSMQPLFIINVGDLVHSGAYDEYLHYYDQIKNFRIPFISVTGNHECHVDGGCGRYVEMFGPTDGYFDYGHTRFIYFNNYVDHQYTMTDDQLDWLEKTLDTDKKVMIFMHAPPDTRVWGGMKRDVSRRFMELVESKGVSRVYFGHIHAYDRLVRGGTTYVMSGGGGAELDPVSNRFLHPISGGFYNLNMVEVNGDAITDILIIPNNGDILSTSSPNGLPVELPYESYRHYNTPIIESVGAEGETVTMKAYSNPKGYEEGITRAALMCFDAQGGQQEPLLFANDYVDERLWSAPRPESTGTCAVMITDPVRSSSIMMPSAHQINPALGDKPSPDDIPFIRVAEDPDEPETLVKDELDILDMSMAYDEKYFYIKVHIKGGPKEGNKDPRSRIINLYGFALINDTLQIEADMDKMFGAIPMLVYAPLATTMGLPKCGILDATDFRSGKFNASDKGITCKADADSLMVRVERSVYGDLESLKGFKLLALSARVLTSPRLDIRPGDASDIVHVRLEGLEMK